MDAYLADAGAATGQPWSPRPPRPPTSGCRRPRPTGCSCSTKPGGVLGPQQPGRCPPGPRSTRRPTGGTGMTTTTEKSTPRTAPATPQVPPRSDHESVRGAGDHPAGRGAAGGGVDSAVQCRHRLLGRPARRWAAGCGGVGAPGRVPGGGVGAHRLALLAPKVDQAVRVPGHRRTARRREARAARGRGPAADVDRTGRVGGGARPVDRRVHLDHAGPGAGVPAAGPGNPGRPGVRVGPGAGRVVPVQPDQPRPGPRTVRPRLR